MRPATRSCTIRILLPLLMLASTALAEVPEGHPPVGAQREGEALLVDVEVLEAMDSGGYTYVRLQVGEGEIWAAVPMTAVQVGDRVTVADGMEMKDFHSRTLDRTFESLWFAAGLVKAGGEASKAVHGAGAANGGTGTMGAAAGGVPLTVEPGSIPRADEGYTVAELFAKRAELSAQQVAVRGKVVRYNAQILGRNWLHIQDGSGDSGTSDLTVTCDTPAKVGDIVLVRGTLTLDKDFGAGYRYPVLVEAVQVTVEH